MKKITELGLQKPDYPTKVIQFGEGNFLRAFIDWQIQQMNKKGLFEGGVAIVKPTNIGGLHAFHEQDNLYTVLLEGLLNGEKVQTDEIITCVNESVDPYEDYEAFLALAEIGTAEVIFSNTTEAGIVFDETDKMENTPPKSFPGKLTALLHHRFELGGKGFQIVPCELINHNGDQLKECVLKCADLWHLGADFKKWVETENDFYATLVDRIVPGYPKDDAEAICDRLGYEDKLLDKAEAFLLFVIEGSKKLKEVLPLKEAGINVILTDDMQPYRERKVRILNGPHTTMTPLGLLAGVETVGEIMEDEDFSKFIADEMTEEISPMVPLPEEELASYAQVIRERFSNPFVRHELMSIALNSISKYKTRLLPVFLPYLKKYGKVPARMTLALAGYLVIYGGFEGVEVKPVDSGAVISRFKELKQSDDYVTAVLSETDFWGEDLTQYPEIVAEVKADVEKLLTIGSRAAVEEINGVVKAH